MHDPTRPAAIISAIVENLALATIHDLELAGAISHPGENGRAREQTIAAFLRRMLPPVYGVSTGFVIDAHGSISRQVDLVIYRTDYHPVFDIGGIRHFPCESVAAVVENKADMGSERPLQQALENIASVKRLDRSNGGKNYTLRGTDRGAEIDTGKFEHQIFGAIVTQHSLQAEALWTKLTSHLHAYPDRKLWPNMYVDVREFWIGYASPAAPDSANHIVGCKTMDAIKLCLCEEREAAGRSLVSLAHELMSFLRVAPVVDYSPLSYLRLPPPVITKRFDLSS